MARILIVDDEKGFRESLRALLIDEHHEVFLADDAEKAIQVLAKGPLDVVITDIIMPRISGIALLNTIHKNYPEVSSIVITGEPCLETATQALRAGAMDYLAKPIQSADVIRLVSKALMEKQAWRQSVCQCQDLQYQLAERTRELHELTDKVRLITEVASGWLRHGSQTDIASRVLGLLAQLVGAEGGSAFLRNAESLHLVDALDPGHQRREIPLPPPPSSVLGTLYETKKAFMVDDVSRQEQTKPSGFSGYRNGAFLAIPIRGDDDQLLGAFTLHDKLTPPFTMSDLRVAEILADQGAQAMKRALELQSQTSSSTRKIVEENEANI